MPYGNQRTSVEGMSSLLPRLLPLEMREAFIAAYDRLRGLARGARRPAVLVAAVDGRARVVDAMCVESGHSLRLTVSANELYVRPSTLHPVLTLEVGGGATWLDLPVVPDEVRTFADQPPQPWTAA